MQEGQSGRSVSLRSRLSFARCLAPTGRLDVWDTRNPGRRGVPLALGYDVSALQAENCPCRRIRNLKITALLTR